jgi:hypothetical protein
VSRPRLLVISLSDLARDPRVDRQLRALRSSYDIVAAGLGPPSVPDVDYIDLDAPASRPAALANQIAGATRMVARRYERAYWGNRLLGEARRRLAGVHPDAVIANDVPALPLAFAVAVDAPVMLDAHEYAPLWFEDRRLWRTVMQPYMTALTRRYVPRVAAMTTVAPALVDAYRELTGVQATVVTNAPEYHDLRPRPVDGQIRLLHHGVANRSRHLERTIEMMGHLDERFTLDLVLVEHEPRHLRHLRRLAAPDSRIRFLDPVPMRDIVRFANDYDVGVFLLPPSNFNYANALPNKLFEFIQARLAVAIGPSPEMARVVEEWGCGVVSRDFEAASLAQTLNALEPRAITEYKHRSHAAAATLSAETSAALLHRMVEHVIVPRALA